MDNLGVILGIFVMIMASIAIIRKYQANMVLLLAGLALNIITLILDGRIMPEGAASGFPLLDMADLLRSISRSQIVGIGFIILVSGGFATYMQAIGASSRFVHLCLNPLKKVKNPYLVLAGAFVVGNALSFAIPSATGLAMLAIVTAYPLLVRLGCSPLSVAAIIASAMPVCYAPISGGAVLAAETVGLQPLDYLIHQQLPMAIPTICVMAIAHAFVQHYFDRNDGKLEAARIKFLEKDTTADESGPLCYGVLPFLPVVLMLVFNRFVFSGLSLNVATAMILSWLLAFFVDLVCRRNPRESFNLSYAMFQGMGRIMTTTVGLVFVAAYFAQGLQNIGIIDVILRLAENNGLSAHGSSLILCGMVGIITILTGSGTAAFTSLAHLVPEMATRVGIDGVSTILMMNTASEMLRPVSPIAGVVIVVAGYAGLNPFAVVRRTLMPCLIGFITMLTTVALGL